MANGRGEREEGREELPIEKRNSFIQEQEKFFELLKSKYPEQAISLTVGMTKGEGSAGNGRGSSPGNGGVMVCA